MKMGHKRQNDEIKVSILGRRLGLKLRSVVSKAYELHRPTIMNQNWTWPPGPGQ